MNTTSNNPESVTKFNIAKEEPRRKANSARDFYFHVPLQNLLKYNPKKFRLSILPKSNLPSSFTTDGGPLCDPDENSNAFNEYFISNFSVDNNFLPFLSDRLYNLSIGTITITAEGIVDLILNFDGKHAVVLAVFLIHFYSGISNGVLATPKLSILPRSAQVPFLFHE